MNDNTSLDKQDWIRIVETEWGYRPLSCAFDADSKTVVATFANELNVRGEMRIMGCTIVPKSITPQAEHPFNAGRSTHAKPTHRVRTQHTL